MRLVDVQRTAIKFAAVQFGDSTIRNSNEWTYVGYNEGGGLT